VKLRLVALSVVVLASASAPVLAAGKIIVVLHQASLATEESRLIEALRIYTRDLECRVRVSNAAPVVLTREALEHIESEATAEGAAIVLWTNRRDDGQDIFYMFDVSTRDLRETEIVPLGVEGAATEVALKARALLALADRRTAATASQNNGDTSGADGERPARTGAATLPNNGGRTTEAPPRTAAPAALSVPGPPSVEAHVEARPAPDSSPIVPRYALDASLALISPRDTTWMRAGLVVTGAVRLGRFRSPRLWLYLDGAFTNRPHAQVNGFDVTLRDVPLAVGVQAEWSSKRTGFAIGSRTSFHVIEVDATGSDGRTGAAWRYSAGLGGLAHGEVRLSARVRATLGVSVEGLVPTQEFTVAGQRALGTGSILIGATTGVVVLIP
jgi:hypothetical protein